MYEWSLLSDIVFYRILFLAFTYIVNVYTFVRPLC